MLITLDREAPLHRQIYDQIKTLILTGAVSKGALLPSSRQLAKDLSVSRNTVLIAYDQLFAEGYLESRRGSGTYVGAFLSAGRPHGNAESRSGAPSNARGSSYGDRLKTLPLETLGRKSDVRYDFHYGTVSASDFPLDLWRRLTLREIRRRTDRPFLYENPQGLPELRSALAAYLARARAVQADPEQILVVNGSQQAIDLAVRVLVDPGAPVVIEDPSYSGARLAFEAAGAQILRTPVDEDGLDVARLPPPEVRPRLVYITPSHQFPTGGMMPVSRRLALLDWAERSGASIFEDDYDSEVRYEGRPVESIQALDRSGRVIYSGTVSKILSPGLRLGYVVLPPDLVETFLRAKQLTDRHTASLDQAVFADLIQDGHFERHIRRVRRRNQRRRDVLLSSLASAFGDRIEIQGGKAGLHIVLWFRDIPSASTGALVEAAARRSIGLYPVAANFDREQRRAGFIMGYAGLDEADIRTGVALLREAADEVVSGGVRRETVLATGARKTP